MLNLFEILNKTFSKFYSPSEHLAVDEIILFKGRVISRQYVTMKHKRFGIKIYKPCDDTGYTYTTALFFPWRGKEIPYRDARFILVNDI